MNEWLPIVGTLAGATVGGAISFLLHWSANRHSRSVLKLNLANEAAKWAVERELEGIRRFYATVEKLSEATGKFRQQQAWEKLFGGSDDKPPSWMLSYADARGGLENALQAANSEKIFLDAKIQSEYDKAIKPYDDWFGATNQEESLECLIELEDSVHKFKKEVAIHFRGIFENRKSGADIGLK